ncbi:LysM peptidoglycan-binding domain-containing protein [Sutcliffiella cohnii]
MDKKKETKDQASELRDKAKIKKAYPPRSKVHADKKKKTKWKIHYPIVRLVFISFLLIPIVILAVTQQQKGNSILSKILPTENRMAEQIQISKPTSQPSQEDKKDEEKDEEVVIVDKQTDSTISEPKDSGNNSNNNTNDPKSEAEPKKEEEKVIDQQKIEDNVEIKYHTVEKEETLYRISMKYYNGRHGEKIIRDYNGLINNDIKEGQVLKIPIKKE